MSLTGVNQIKQCPICLEVCQDPRSLPCLHTFCFNCIERHCELKNAGDGADCPVCRDEFKIPESGISKLRENIHHNTLNWTDSMTISRRMARVDDVTRCPICLEDCRDPRSLPCLHTFCFKCIERRCEGKLQGEKVGCPVCTEEFQIPKNGGISRLTHNFFIDNLISQKSAYSLHCRTSVVGLFESREMCSQCVEKHGKDASFFCLNCAQKLCNSCGKECTGANAHKVVKLRDETNHANRKYRGNYCDAHSNELWRMYCVQCQSSICTVCYVTNHYSHELTEIDEAAMHFRIQIRELVSQLQIKLLEVNELYEQLKCLQQSFRSMAGNVRDSIVQSADKARKQADDRTKHRLEKDQRDLLEELSTVEVQTDKKLLTEQEHAEFTQMTMGSFISYANAIVNKGSSSDITRAVLDLQVRANELQKIECNVYRPPSITFKPTVTGKTGLLKRTKIATDNSVGKLLIAPATQLLHVTSSGNRSTLIRGPVEDTVESAQVQKEKNDQVHAAAENQICDMVKKLSTSAANDCSKVPKELSGHEPLDDKSDDSRSLYTFYFAPQESHVDVDREPIGHSVSVDMAKADGVTPQFIVAENDASVNSATTSDAVQLHIAAHNGHVDVVKEVIDNETSATSSNVIDRTDGYAPLHIVPRNGHVDVVRAIGDDAPVNSAKADGVTPLFIAAEKGHVDVVRELIAQGASVNSARTDGATPLFIAALNGHASVVRELIARGGSVNSTTTDGATPLYIAAQNGHVDVVKELISHGASVDMGDTDGHTPLLIAAQNGHVEVVKDLIQHGASANSARKDGITPLFVASHSGYVDVVKELTGRGASVIQAGKNVPIPLCIAARYGHADVVKELISSGAPVNSAKADGVTPLLIAAENGHAGVVRELISHSASIDMARTDGITPLFFAAENGHVDIVRELIGNGASVNSARADGATPLLSATLNGHVGAVRELIVGGAAFDMTKTSGYTPIFIAARHGHVDVVRELIGHGASVNSVKRDGVTPLLFAARHGHIDVVRELLSHGASANSATTDGTTPLFIAAHNGHHDIVNMLIANGASTDKH